MTEIHMIDTSSRSTKAPPDLAEVQAGFADLASRYLALKQECEARATSWRWASDGLYEPQPLYVERQGYKKGRFLGSAPKKQDGKLEYGLEAAGGPIHVARSHVRFDGYPERRWFYETFYVRSHDRIEVSHFSYDPEKQPISFGVGTYTDGMLMSWLARARYGVSQETYVWEDGRVTRIDVEHAPVDKKDGHHPPLVLWGQYEFRYGGEGAIEEILCHGPGRPGISKQSTHVVYRRRPSEVSFDDLLSKARSALIAAVVDRIRAAQISEPVYSLALAWSPGQQESLPPSIGVGLQAEREGWLRELGDRAKWTLWNPAEYRHFLDLRLDDEVLKQACRAVNQECRLKDSWKPVAKALNQMAQELGQMEWSGILQTTDDFVCYATDLEMAEFKKNLKASAPPELVEMFKKNGWLMP